MSRLLRGPTRLSCSHVLAILGAFEVTPAFFDSTLYPGPEDARRAEDPRLAEVRAMRGRIVRRLDPAGAAEPVASPPAAAEELAVRIERAAWRMADMDRPQERPREKSGEPSREGEEEPEPGRERPGLGGDRGAAYARLQRSWSALALPGFWRVAAPSPAALRAG